MLANLAIINANVLTMNPHQPVAQAVAIRKNIIIKVGTNQEVNKFVSKGTKIISLDGKTVVPGLIDTHIHVADFGRCLLWLDLTNIESVRQLQSFLKEKTTQTSAGKWLIGRGWNQNRFKEKRLLNVSDLDSVTPVNPVILYHEAAMTCVVNSKAIEIACLTKQTAATSGGIIGKDPKTGELTGVLEGTATNLVWLSVPEPTFDELFEATSIACNKIAEVGVTSVHWLVLSENELPIIERLRSEGKLLIRVNVVVPETLLEKAAGLKSAEDYRLHVGGVALYTDGYLDSKTAALSDPYNDEPNNSGNLFLAEQSLTTSVTRILETGFQPVIHAMGDKAIDTALKVMEQSSVKTVRFRLEQAALLNPKLIKRLKSQKVIVTVQPKVISTEFSVWLATERLGVERAMWLHPLKTLFKEGIKVAAGSDCPMEPLNPLVGIQEAVTRESFPEQRLNVQEALRMYTVYAAYSSCEENIKGSIEPHKLADLTVLSSDPYSVPINAIKNIDVEMVIIDGQIIFSKN